MGYINKQLNKEVKGAKGKKGKVAENSKIMRSSMRSVGTDGPRMAQVGRGSPKQKAGLVNSIYGSKTALSKYNS